MEYPARPNKLDFKVNRDAGKAVDYKEVARKLKNDYAHGSKDPSIRALDSVNSLIKNLIKNDPDLDEMLEQTAKLIFTQFNIREVSIALKTAPDNLYRYVKMHGMRAEVWVEHLKIAYTHDQILDPKTYKHTVISQNTRLFLAEDNPYGEEETRTYNEHLMTMSKRKSPDDGIEGDYMDVFIYGPGDEILGWIETGNTWDNKIPDARTVRTLELLSSVLGIAITRHKAITGQDYSPPAVSKA